MRLASSRRPRRSWSGEAPHLRPQPTTTAEACASSASPRSPRTAASRSSSCRRTSRRACSLASTLRRRQAGSRPSVRAQLRERVSEGSLCGARNHVRERIATRSLLRAAAKFLDLDREQLRAQLPGTSLAGLAEKQGKSASALEAAMVAPAKARLAKAVEGKKLSQDRADEILAKLEQGRRAARDARLRQEVARRPSSNDDEALAGLVVVLRQLLEKSHGALRPLRFDRTS